MASDAAIINNKLTTAAKVKWLITIGFPLLIILLPTNAMLTVSIKNFIAVTLLAILLFAFELVDTLVASLILMFGYIIAQVAPLSTIMQPWTQEIPWIMVSSLLLVNIVRRTALLQRIAYFCAIKTGGSYLGIIMGMITIGVIMSVLVPSNIVVIGLMVIAYSLCVSLDLGISKASAGIMLATTMGLMDAYFFVYSPTYISLLYNAVQAVVPVEPNYIVFFKDNAVFLVSLYLKGYILAKIFQPKKAINGKAYFVEQQAQLPTMNRDEKKILYVLLALVAYLMTYQFHHQAMMYGFIIAPILLYLPGFNIGTKEDVKNIDYTTVVFIAACMSIGSAANAAGVGPAFSALIFPLLEGTSKVVFLMITWLIIVIFNFLMTPAAEMTTFGLPFAQICLDYGINVYPMMYTFFQAGSTLLMPYEAAMWLVAYSFGLFKLKHFVMFMGIKAIFDFIFLFAIGVPYWTLIGIL